MPTAKPLRFASLRVQLLECRLTPSGGSWTVETFDGTPTGSLPVGWAQWSSSGNSAFAVSTGRSVSGSNGLSVTEPLSNLSARSWLSNPQPADVQVGAAVYLDTLIPVQILARGNSLNTSTPSYYALSLTRGLQAQLVRVTNGVATTLATINSSSYFSGRWVQATLNVQGNSLQAQIYRPDTKQYLNAQGQWQSGQAWALNTQDGTLKGAGEVGVGRPSSYTGTATIDDFEFATATTVSEQFDTTPSGSLPTGWSQWSNTGSPVFAVSPSQALSAPNGLSASATVSSTAARAWSTAVSLADVQVGAAVYLNGLIPAQVFGRGTNLAGSTPSYYALSITRGLQVQLLRVVQGVTTVLGQASSADWVNNVWVRVMLYASGSTVRAEVYRVDTGMYLTASGQWQVPRAWAIAVTDTGITGAGLTGLARPASYAGQLSFDDFSALPADGDHQTPTVTLSTPAPGATLTGTVTITATATDNVGVVRVVFDVDGTQRAVSTAGPYQWTLDTTTLSNATHSIEVLAYDDAGNVGQAEVIVTVYNANALPQPTIPQHYPNIRIAELAYQGTPIGTFEDQLLSQSVDLVITDPSNVSTIAAVAPHTPQLLYTNVSTLYGSLLTNWLDYANANGLNPEDAFYHVTQATAYSGTSPSSQPVEWFWSVARGSGSSWTDLTAQARRTSTGGVTFGTTGQSVVVGYTDPFREIDMALQSAAAGGWAETLEYPTQVDASGNPTAWATLNPLTDTTTGLTHSGQILFDPPANWKMASINGSAELYYVRFRTTSAGTAPVALSILGADYTNAGNGTSGIIPAFDYSADLNHDGYLDNAEYAKARSGYSARFAYQSRSPYGSYGEERFATNPSQADFRTWVVAYSKSLLASVPAAAGLFVDNSSAVAPVSSGSVVESLATYATDYGTLLNAVAQAVSPDWLMANTAGGGTTADAVIIRNTAYFEEFALRPLAANYLQFEDTAALIAHRAALQSPSPYAVLDALPTNGSPTDPRTQIATLAEYYLLADPTRTFLDPFGGYSPASSWTQHWFNALTYNVGQPTDSWSIFASGIDPSDATKTYRVYARSYQNALVLYKPLSSNANGSATGTLSDATATVIPLSGTYRPLNADGTLGAAETSVTLRNGEGAILIKMT